MSEGKLQKRNLTIFGAILFVTLLLTRMPSIMNFVAVDEVNWLHRSAIFYNALIEKNWERTFVNQSPGVITTWVGSLAFMIEFPEFRIERDSILKHYSEFDNFIRNKGKHPLIILRTARVIMASLLMGMLIFSYYFAQRFFGLSTAFIGFMLISLDPFFAALTRTNHLDAPQAIFMFLSLMALLNYSYGEHRLRDLLISGAAGGLSVLTKLPGLFILPIVGSISAVANFEHWTTEKTRDLHVIFKLVRKMISPMLIWTLVFFLVIFALWPALWATPTSVLGNIIGLSSIYATTTIETEGTITQKTTGYYTRYVEAFYDRTSPIILMGVIFGIWGYFTRRTIFKGKKLRQGILGLLLFVGIYIVGMTLPSKSSDKYIAPVILAMDFFAGLGWYGFAREMEMVVNGKISVGAPIAILTLILALQSIGNVETFPYYFTYFNPMTGGLKAAAERGSVGVGEGLNLAGKYLADKSNSSKPRVLSWYGEGPLSYYFNGPVDSLYMSNSSWDVLLQRLKVNDYLVVYQNQKSRNQPPELFIVLENAKPEFTAVIDGVEMAWVYKIEELELPISAP